MKQDIRISAAALLLAAFGLTTPAFAADEKPEWLPENSLGVGIPTLADPTGVRQALWLRGIKVGVTYTGEYQGVSSGGLGRGSRYGHRFDFYTDVDLEKAVGWTGATFHANVFQITGTGISRYYLANLMAVSNIEALPTTRLFEAWIEQKLLDGKLGVKFGQLAADTEFAASNYAGLFINGTFGWPTIHAANLPSGGPAYPLATPGVRISYAPNDNLTLLAGIYNGDPSGPGAGDPQTRNRYGLNFRVRDPAFAISEVQYKYGDEKDPRSLSGSIKLGAWTHFGRFNNGRYGTDGLSLADPLSNGTPASTRGNYGFYGIIDQQVYRLAADPTKGIGIFARLGASPSNRNLVDFYADAGVNFSGLVPGRPDDSFGFAFGYAQISPQIRGFDQDVNFFNATLAPVRSSEAVFEATYNAQIVPGWTIQPNFQYIFRPGGNVPDPTDPAGLRAVRNAVVIGVRSVVRY